MVRIPQRGLLLKVALAGFVLTAGQAWGRFAGLGAPAGLVFPPEVLAQWLFGIIPMNLFTVGVRALGAAAKWVAFGVTVSLWIVTGGFLLLAAARGAHALSTRLGGGPKMRLLSRAAAAVATAAVIEGAWGWAGRLIYTGAGGAGFGLSAWPALILLLFCYWAGLSLCAGAIALPEAARPADAESSRSGVKRRLTR